MTQEEHDRKLCDRLQAAVDELNDAWRQARSFGLDVEISSFQPFPHEEGDEECCIWLTDVYRRQDVMVRR